MAYVPPGSPINLFAGGLFRSVRISKNRRSLLPASSPLRAHVEPGDDGDEWGVPMEVMDVPDAKAGSYEDVFHRAGAQNRLLFTDEIDAGDPLAEPRGHRAIGVVYHPEFEPGNYVPTDLCDRYDAFLHVDATGALHPLELHPDRERVPELYPVGL